MVETNPFSAPPAADRDNAVPADRADRERLRAAADRYARQHELTPPLTADDLRMHARRLLVREGGAPEWLEFVAVLLNNALWRDIVAATPFDRRLLLLPQCLRPARDCPAKTDALGVLCQACGRCPIGEIQELAERLGYLTLVAEGATVVSRLIESGQVDAVIGVSCLSVLERAFPRLSAEAIPGIAIPLLREGCRDTLMDLDWAREAIELRSSAEWFGRSDLERLHEEVMGWFREEELRRWFGAPAGSAERIAREWLARGGKRWRPFLVAAAWRALQENGQQVPPPVRSLALAVECFHKASLIHDDIEDGDPIRYGRPAVHVEHGVPIAINVGDALVGEGYRRIAECGAPAERIASLLAAATEGHRALCEGQGEELAWLREPRPLEPRQVLDIFRLKTAPAFEVALRLGTLAAGDRSAAVEAAVREYSAAIGVAYQIRDDLDDLDEPPADGDLVPRLSILSALAWETAAGPQKQRVANDWCRPSAGAAARLAAFIRQAGVVERARLLLEHHRNAAIRSLEQLHNVHLKSLLRRIVGRMLPRP
ncbi:MAG: polyprenyl synthetase family protein [Kiritimatiellae bacterium]|nr:polyprenyl synthetase family protein [Kiritimatiellia bacterium]